MARTPLSTLKALVTGLRDHGVTNADMVLWDAEEPHLVPAVGAADLKDG